METENSLTLSPTILYYTDKSIKWNLDVIVINSVS